LQASRNLTRQISGGDNTARFNAINARNYSDLWFYSNPVFVKVAAQ
jgi:hypothetical protein